MQYILLAEHAVIACDQLLYGNKSYYGNRPSSQKQVKSEIRPRRYYLPISLFTRPAYDALIAVHATQNRITWQRQNNRIKISVFLFPGSTRRDERKMRSAGMNEQDREYTGNAASIAAYHRRPCGRNRSRYRNYISRPAFAGADGGNMRLAARQEGELGRSICRRT